MEDLSCLGLPRTKNGARNDIKKRE